MKKSYFIRQIVLLVLEFLLVGILFYRNRCGEWITRENVFHFILVSLLVFDAVWISYRNIQDDRVLNHFSYLLLLAGGQFLFALFEESRMFVFFSELLLPIVMYQTIYFLQLFLLQGSAYRYQKGCLGLLKLTSAVSVLCRLVSVKWFWWSYFIEFLVSISVVLFLGIVHRKRILFVVKSQKKDILCSFLFVVLPFACYIAVFFRNPGYLENMGGYLVIMVSAVSVHSMIFRDKKRDYAAVLKKKNRVAFLTIAAAVFAAAAWGLWLSAFEILIFLHCLCFLAQCYFLILYWQTIHVPKDFENSADRNHFYQYSLSRMRREEELRKEFSNYLHDNILQDLLSVKNLAAKADKPEIRKLISDTLEKLNQSIRRQMQHYHPAFLKSMTLKENILSQIDAVCSGFRGHTCKVSFDCDDSVFLVAPYDTILCRIIQELTVNALKHSQGKNLQIILIQEKGSIYLKVEDDGIGFEREECDGISHRGLASIQEQVSLLDGNIKVRSVPGGGTEIVITMPMRGEGSYENFISR